MAFHFMAYIWWLLTTYVRPGMILQVDDLKPCCSWAPNLSSSIVAPLIPRHGIDLLSSTKSNRAWLVITMVTTYGYGNIHPQV